MPRPDEGMIHAWLDGELTAEEATRVAKLVAEDAEWEAAAAEARGLIAASSRIVGALDVVPAGVIPAGSRAAPERKPRFTVRPWMRMAAGVVIVVGISSVLWPRTADTPVLGELAAPTAAPTAATSLDEAVSSTSVVAEPTATAAQGAASAPTAASSGYATAATRADSSSPRRPELERDAAPPRENRVAVGAAAQGVVGARTEAAAPAAPADAPKKAADATAGLARDSAALLAAGKVVVPEARVAGGLAAGALDRAARQAPPVPALAERARAESALQFRSARADAMEDALGVLPGCWRTQVAGRPDTVLENPRIARQSGDTLTLVVAADGRTAIVRRDGEATVRGTTRFGSAPPLAVIGTRATCPPR